MTNSTILSLPLDEVLGFEFTVPENRLWLAAWSDRFMTLDPSAARGWWSDGSQVVSGTLGWGTTSSDWLEITVDINRRSLGHLKQPGTPDPVWSIETVLSVSCWCQDNHNAHTVRESAREVGSTSALEAACADALSLAQSWISSSVDPETWRRRADLALRSDPGLA